MTIEFDIDLMRQKVKLGFTANALDKIIQQELQKIVAKHKQAAQEEVNKFIAVVLVSERMYELGMVQRCKITLPDLDSPVQTPSVVT